MAVSTKITGSVLVSTPALPTSSSWSEWQRIKGLMVGKKTTRKPKEIVPEAGQLFLL